MSEVIERPGVPRLLLEPWEAAESLGISVSKLEKWTSKGYVPSVKVDSMRRYPVDRLRSWVNRGCPLEPQDPAEEKE